MCFFHIMLQDLSDAEQLILVVAFFYLLETIYWVKPGAGLWVSTLGVFRHRFKTSFRSALLANESGGLVFGNFLPLGSSTCCEAWPFSASPHGLLAYTPYQLDFDPVPHSGRFVAWKDFEKATCDGRKVLVNGKPFLAAASSSLALRYTRLFKAWKETPDAERGAAVQAALRETLDAEGARDGIRKARRSALMLRGFCCAAFGFVFIAIPVMLRYDIPIELWMRMLLCYAVLQLAIGFDYYASHRDLLKESGERNKHIFLVLLSPADAMHAHDTLMREVMEGWHPLTLGKAVGNRGDEKDLAEHYARDADHPLPAGSPPEGEAKECLDWFAKEYRERIHEAAGTLPAKPEADAGNVVGFCPRCHGQVVRLPVECTMCRLPARPFGNEIPPEPSAAA